MATAGVPDFTKADEFWIEVVQPRIAQIQSVSPRDSKSLVEHARQALDNELDAMHRAICRLRTRRNALSPISSLPVEILARIFQFSAAEMSPSKSNRTPPGPLGWIHLTHICKCWRDAALHHPSLWANINSKLGGQWLALRLARAKSAPISLSFSYLGPDDIHLVAKHLPHTQSLVLFSAPDILEEAFPSLISPAPILSSLELHAAFPDDEDSESETQIVLPGDIFSAQTPMLRQLRLDNVALSWSCPALTNLTSLCVYHGIAKMDDVLEPGSPASDNASQYDHFFDALTRMPRLEKLQLEGCLPQKSQGSSMRKHVTALPNLKSLILDDMPEVCIDIAKHLKIPSSCSLILRCNGDHIPGLHPPIADLSSFFEASYPSHEESSFRELSILLPSRMGGKTICMTLRRTLDTPEADYHSIRRFYAEKSDISVWFPLPPPSVVPLEALCRVLPLDGLRFLTIRVDHAGWSAHTWFNAFGRCSALEHIYVEAHNTVHFLNALLLSVDDGSEPTSGIPLRTDRLFLRNLKSVTISNVDLFTGVVHANVKKPFIEYLLIWLRRHADCIQNAVSDRSGGHVGEADGRLRKLCIVESMLLASYISPLQRLVQELEWDEDAVF